METNEMYVNILKWLAIGLIVSFGIGFYLSNNLELLMNMSVKPMFWIAVIGEVVIA